MIVVWSPEAEQDRAGIWDYIAADNPGEAIHMDELFSDAVARLAAHPKMGNAGRISGTRELIPHESFSLGVRDSKKRETRGQARADQNSSSE